MTLPASGPISVSQINAELGYAAGTQFSFNSDLGRIITNAPTGATSVSGVYNRLATQHYALTIGYTSLFGGVYGWNAGGFGHISSTVLKGYTMNLVQYEPENTAIAISLTLANVPASTITSITCSLFGTLTNPTYAPDISGSSSWHFAIGSNPWTVVDKSYEIYIN